MKKNYKINWDDYSNNEIQIKQLELQNEYEVKKKLIMDLCDELDAMDILYNESVKILNTRLKK
jgi:hypothetical protein